jgi:RHS repeat-associated protein
MATETYPSGKVIETQFDGAGRIAGVKKQSASGYIAGAASTENANRLQYTAHGAASVMKLGNGLWEHTNFNSRLQPTQIGLGTTSTTSGTLQLDYGYGTTTNNGNLMSQLITIQVPGQNSLTYSQSYSYDQVNRLLSASEGANWNQQYGYDVYGNRWVQPSSTYIPNPSLTPQSLSAFSAANNRLTTALGFNYDAVGNLTSDPTTALNAMVYDAENRQTSYTKAGVTTHYDGDGRRVKKEEATGATVFVYNAGGQLVAEYSDAGGGGTVTMSYLTSDHLGSTRVVTDGTGVVKARHDYLPFGEEIGSNIGGRDGVTGYTAVDLTRQKFTGQQRDTESGLDYFTARYYSSAQGRFTSPDLFGGFALAPQMLNLYAYTHNNPLNFVDPSGHYSLSSKIEKDVDKRHANRRYGLYQDGKPEPPKGYEFTPNGSLAKEGGKPVVQESVEVRGSTSPANGGGWFSKLWGGIKSAGRFIGRIFPRTGGGTVSGTASGGLGIYGGGADVAVSGGFYNDYAHFSKGHGAAISGGAFLGPPSPNEGFGIPYGSQNPGGSAIGAYAGVGLGVFFSNAPDYNSLGGDFNTTQINTPIGGFQFDYSGGIYVISVTGGPGIGASAANYTTTTPVTLQTPPILPIIWPQ